VLHFYFDAYVFSKYDLACDGFAAWLVNG